jgi:hypothetical protein
MADGTLPTFSEIPEFDFLRKDRYSCLKSNWEEGMSLRRAITGNLVRVFTLTWKNATKTIKDTIMTLFRERCGGAGAFNYTPTDESSAIKCRFDEDSLTWNKVAYNNYNIKFNLVELL